MPWTNVTYMEEIKRFVILARSGRFTVTELNQANGVMCELSTNPISPPEPDGANGVSKIWGLGLANVANDRKRVTST